MNWLAILAILVSFAGAYLVGKWEGIYGDTSSSAFFHYLSGALLAYGMWRGGLL